MRTRAGRDALAVFVVLVVAVAAGFVREYSGDFHWHVVLGDWTLANGAVYRTDVHSASFDGQPMFVSSWFADVLFALAFRGGYLGVFLLRAVALAGMSALLVVEARARGVRSWVASLAVGLVLVQSFFVFYLRPESLAFGLFALLLALLGRHQRAGSRRLLLAVLALLVVWANMHASVGIGLFAVGLYAAQAAWRAFRLRDRQGLAIMLVLPLLGLAATCLNPEGIGLPLSFRVVRALWVGRVYEWLPMGANVPPLLLVAASAILLTTAGALALGRRTEPWLLVLVIVLAALAIQHRRFATYALIPAVPLLATNLAVMWRALEERRSARAWRHLGQATAALLALWLAAMLFVDRNVLDEIRVGIDDTAPSYPIDAVAFARKVGLSGPVLNDYDFGSYLMYALPGAPVLIDQRAWSIYSDDFYQSYFAAAETRDGPRALADGYGMGWAIQRYNPLAQQLAADTAHWRLLYFDDKAVIYVRPDDPRYAALAEHEGFRIVDPARAAVLAELRPEFHDQIRAELRRQAERCPDCRVTHLVTAAASIALGDREAHGRAMQRLLDFGETPEVAFLAARQAIAVGDREQARVMLERYRALGGHPGPAAFLESQLR